MATGRALPRIGSRADKVDSTVPQAARSIPICRIAAILMEAPGRSKLGAYSDCVDSHSLGLSVVVAFG